MQGLIDKCHWTELAGNLKRDLDELPSITFPKKKEDLKHMRALLESIRDDWFYATGPDLEDSASWMPSIKACEWQGRIAAQQRFKEGC